jgi:hypothetical protein
MALEQLVAKGLLKETLTNEMELLKPKLKVKGGKKATKQVIAQAMVDHYSRLRERLGALKEIAHDVATGEIDEETAGVAEADVLREADEEDAEQDAEEDLPELRLDPEIEADAGEQVDQVMQEEEAETGMDVDVVVAGNVAGKRKRAEGEQAEGGDAGMEAKDGAAGPTQLELAAASMKSKQIYELDKRQSAIDEAMHKLETSLSVLRLAYDLGYDVSSNLQSEPPLQDEDEPPPLQDSNDSDDDDPPAEPSAEAMADLTAHATEDKAEDAAKSKVPKVTLKSVALLPPPPLPSANASPPPPPLPQPTAGRSGNAPKAGSLSLLSLVGRLRQLLLRIYAERVKPADKLLAFMLSDLSHMQSVCVARFGVTSSMDSTTLNELVEHVLFEIRQASEGVIDAIFERADGARTNLVREARASVRSSKRPSMPGDQGELPCSMREVALDTNEAVRLWRLRRDGVVWARHGALQSDEAKREMKSEIYRAYCRVAMRCSARHWPNLHGWLHRVMRKRAADTPAGCAGLPPPTDIEDEDAMVLEKLEKWVDDDAKWDDLERSAAMRDESLGRAFDEGGQYHLEMQAYELLLSLDAKAEASGVPADVYMVVEDLKEQLEKIHLGIPDEVYMVLEELKARLEETQEPRRFTAPSNARSFAAPRTQQRPPPKAMGAHRRQRAKVLAAQARAMRVRKQREIDGLQFNTPHRGGPLPSWMLQPSERATPPAPDKSPIWKESPGGGFMCVAPHDYDEYDREFVEPPPPPPPPLPKQLAASRAHERRVSSMVDRREDDPQWAAVKGAHFSSRWLHKSQRLLFERLRDMRPPNHHRPLQRKMAAKLASTPSPTMDELLKASKLRPMPTGGVEGATPFGSEGLAAALLMQDEYDGGGSAEEWMTRGFATMAALQMERYMREAVDADEISVKEMLYELRVALMDRMVHELASVYNLDLRDQTIIRNGHYFIQCPVGAILPLTLLTAQ